MQDVGCSCVSVWAVAEPSAYVTSSGTHNDIESGRCVHAVGVHGCACHCVHVPATARTRTSSGGRYPWSYAVPAVNTRTTTADRDPPRRSEMPERARGSLSSLHHDAISVHMQAWREVSARTAAAQATQRWLGRAHQPSDFLCEPCLKQSCAARFTWQASLHILRWHPGHLPR
jgi:hypothetical protein